MILLAEHDEPLLAAKKKRPLAPLTTATSIPKNRVWGFANTLSGRPNAEPELSWETATGSVQYTYQIASGRAEWQARDPLPMAEMSQGPNLYEYVGNDPIDLSDPLGLFGFFVFVSGTGHAGAGTAESVSIAGADTNGGLYTAQIAAAGAESPCPTNVGGFAGSEVTRDSNGCVTATPVVLLEGNLPLAGSGAFETPKAMGPFVHFNTPDCRS